MTQRRSIGATQGVDRRDRDVPGVADDAGSDAARA